MSTVSEEKLTTIVIVAGHDTQVNGVPAPLLRIAGMTNVCRAIKSAAYSGAKECRLVVTHGSEEIIKEARRCWEERGPFSVHEVSEGSGDLSALRAAAEELDTRAIVLFADLAFSRNLLQGLLREDIGDDLAVVAAGEAGRFAGDPFHAPIGSPAKSFSGLLVIRPALMGKIASSGTMPVAEALAQETVLETIRLRPMDNSFTKLVRTESDRRTAESLLVRSLRRNTDGIVSRWLNRPVSLFLSRFFFSRLPLTPNHITLLAGAIGWVAIALMFAWPGYTWVVIGALLFHISSILDGCDGEVARLRFQFSRFGEWLDNVLDEINNAAFVAGIGIGIWSSGGDEVYLWATVFYCLTVVIVDSGYFYQMIRWHGGSGSVDNIRWFFQKPSSGPRPDPTTFLEKPKIADILMQLPRRDFYILMLLILAILDVLYIGFWVSVGVASLLFVLGCIQWIWMLAGGPDRLSPGPATPKE